MAIMVGFGPADSGSTPDRTIQLFLGRIVKWSKTMCLGLIPLVGPQVQILLLPLTIIFCVHK